MLSKVKYLKVSGASGARNLFRVKLLHQARFAASSIVSMDNPFFGSAV
jgi:hypothetical protein